MTYERTNQTNVLCPVCGHLACNFIPAKINRAVLGHEWFEAMRRTVAEAKTADLFFGFGSVAIATAGTFWFEV